MARQSQPGRGPRLAGSASATRALPWLLLAVWLWLGAGPAWAQRVVVVGVYDNPPAVAVSSQGDVYGIFPDLLQAVAQREGWRLRWVPGTWSQSLDRLSEGQVDLLVAVGYSAQRARTMAFNQQTVIVNYGQVYVPVQSRVESLLDLEGVNVATLRGDIHGHVLRDLLAQFQVRPRYVEVETYAEVLRAVQDGRAQAGVVNRLWGNLNETNYQVRKSPLVFNPIELRFAAPPNRKDLLEVLDQYLATFKAMHDSPYNQTLERWLTLGGAPPRISTEALWMMVTAGTLALFFMGASIWLRRRVRIRTADLEREKARLQEEVEVRARTEAELRDSESRFRNLYQSMAQGVIYHDHEGLVIGANPAAERILGLGIGQMRCMPPQDANWRAWRENGEEFPADQHPALQALRTGQPQLDVVMGIHNPREDARRWIRINAVPEFRPCDPQPFRVFTTFDDITALKNLEADLRRSRAQYQELFQHAGDAIFLLDPLSEPPGRIMDANQAAADMHGYTQRELLDMSIHQLYQANSVPMVHSRLRQMSDGHWMSLEVQHLRKDGSLFPVEISAGPVTLEDKSYILAFDRDISQRKRDEERSRQLERQLRQSQKMEALGTLAGGIAHDFNNILGAVYGYAELALDEMQREQRPQRELEQVLSGCERARELIKRILAFSRQSENEPKLIRLDEMVREGLRLMRATLPTTVEMRERLDTGDTLVLADPTQMQQVIMNLCTNAAQAMEDKGGLLEVSLEREEITERLADLAPGTYAVLGVRDQGPGIPPQVRARIFEPFFTTKERGKGTGMGLAMVHGIVSGHRGVVRVESVLGQGSLFKVYLPLVERGEINDGEPREQSPRGNESILLVDDEPLLVEVGQRLLRKLGYQVTGMDDPLLAWERVQKQPHGFDLVISDQTMPGLTGLELAVRVHSLNPNLPVILTSGYSDKITKERLDQAGVRELIPKPLNQAALAQVVRRVLDGAQPAS